MPKNNVDPAFIKLIKERSLKTLKFIEDQISETDEVTTGEVMVVLVETLRLFIDDVRLKAGEERANKIAANLRLLLMFA